MTAPGDVLEALQVRRARLAALADELRDRLDRNPSPMVREELEDVVAALNSLDRLIAARRGKP